MGARHSSGPQLVSDSGPLACPGSASEPASPSGRGASYPSLLGSSTPPSSPKSAALSPPASPWRGRRTDRKRTAGVVDLAKRGISLEQVTKMYVDIRSNGVLGASTRTFELVKDFVIPETAAEVCSLSNSTFLKLRGGRHAPQKLVSHSWNAMYSDTLVSILMDVTSMGPGTCQSMLSEVPQLSSKDVANVLQGMAVWMDVFSVNHHSSICGTELFPCQCNAPKYVRGHLCCQTDKYRQLAASMPQGIILAIDNDPTAFSRVWCIAESLAASVDADEDALDEESNLFTETTIEDIPSIRFEKEWQCVLHDTAHTIGPYLFSAEVKTVFARCGPGVDGFELWKGSRPCSSLCLLETTYFKQMLEQERTHWRELQISSFDCGKFFEALQNPRRFEFQYRAGGVVENPMVYVLGLLSSWQDLKDKFRRPSAPQEVDGDALLDAIFFEVVGPGPKLFAVTKAKAVYQHHMGAWLQYHDVKILHESLCP
eukprot:TRINITY_DN83228_c0_g1_i1.p1 TRINITY_DN83228_c0_g1~~TRINITY_DN83228_c0_g1_i1.p1  ORF type:complete len:502 (-),score=64.80 TRINITY_DN83228_c0_g1_i1:487-1938(-)